VVWIHSGSTLHTHNKYWSLASLHIERGGLESGEQEQDVDGGRIDLPVYDASGESGGPSMAANSKHNAMSGNSGVNLTPEGLQHNYSKL
jgi:hypothetical protein